MIMQRKYRKRVFFFRAETSVVVGSAYKSSNFYYLYCCPACFFLHFHYFLPFLLLCQILKYFFNILIHFLERFPSILMQVSFFSFSFFDVSFFNLILLFNSPDLILRIGNTYFIKINQFYCISWFLQNNF